MNALARLVALMLVMNAAAAAGWSCYGTKPGHPTRSERAAFVQDVSALAIAAERKHGVPAAALAALAIIESGYGWTRLAVEANNVFAWKAGPSDVQREHAFVPVCQRAKPKDHYLVFANRAEAFDVVAAKLAMLEGFAEYTRKYSDARKRGAPVEAAVNGWVAGIAARYSRRPREFSDKMVRVMRDPEQQGKDARREHSLYELSRKAGGKR